MREYDVYISAPLFSEMEIEFNKKIDKMLENIGLTTYLPQRDGGEDELLLKNPELYVEAGKRVFKRDVDALKNSKILLIILDGRTVDEGACVELGMAYAYSKIIIGIQTDVRRFSNNYNNLMIDYSINRGIYNNTDELKEAMLKIKDSV